MVSDFGAVQLRQAQNFLLIPESVFTPQTVYSSGIERSVGFASLSFSP